MHKESIVFAASLKMHYLQRLLHIHGVGVTRSHVFVCFESNGKWINNGLVCWFQEKRMASGARPGSLVPPKSNSSSGIFPGLRTPDDPQVETCTHIDTHYDLIIASLCSVFIVCGILYTYFGKYCIQFYNFLTENC